MTDGKNFLRNSIALNVFFHIAYLVHSAPLRIQVEKSLKEMYAFH